MIYIIYGTRAELIKLSYFIKRLKQKKISFRLVDTGQQDTFAIRNQLRIQKPDFFFGKSLRDKWSKLPFALGASLALFWGIPIFGRMRRIFEKEARVVIIHGNSMSAALAVSAAKSVLRRKIILVHFESGLRGHKKQSRFVDRFYRLVDKNSDFLFAPYKSCYDNLKKERNKSRIVMSGDSYFDVISEVEKMKVDQKIPQEKYVLFNSIRSLDKKGKARQVVKALLKSPIKIVAVLNPFIKHNLKKFGLLTELERSNNVDVVDSIPYLNFLQLLKNSSGVVTDSAGVQEEAVFFNKPCLVTNEFIQISEFINFGFVKVVGCNGQKILAHLIEIAEGKGIYELANSFRLDYSKGEATERIIREMRLI